MVEFFAEGWVQNAFLPGRGGHADGGDAGGGNRLRPGQTYSIIGVSRDDMLNPRRGAGTRYETIVGLPPGRVINLLSVESGHNGSGLCRRRTAHRVFQPAVPMVQTVSWSTNRAWQGFAIIFSWVNAD